MKYYLVTIKVSLPYPKEFEYKVRASNPPTAIRRAYRLVREQDLKGKRLDTWEFKVVSL